MAQLNSAKIQSTHKKWEAICCERGIDTFLVNISDVIAFLTNMFEMGLGYSSICSARSGLNCIVCLPGYSDIT